MKPIPYKTGRVNTHLEKFKNVATQKVTDHTLPIHPLVHIKKSSMPASLMLK